MAVGRISGPLLKDNLLRNGINLAFETNLLYLDVVNGRIGINTASPTNDLSVVGTTRSTNLQVTTSATLATITVTGNTISSTSNTINLLPSGVNPVVYQGTISVGSLNINTNTIATTGTNTNLEVTTTGTGAINLNSNVTIFGNLHATGNITADGNITLGDAPTDTVSFNADIASSIIPSTSAAYDLGSSSLVWANLYATNVITTDVSTTNFTANGNITVTGTSSLTGTIQLGTDGTNTVSFVAQINSNLVPLTTATYNLGSPSLYWNNVYTTTANINGLTITSNTISTTATNTNMQLVANGTGKIYVPSNDVQIDQSLTVGQNLTVTTGTTTLKAVGVTGAITQTGDINQTGNFVTSGNTQVTGNITASGYVQMPNITISSNTISTNTGNLDLNLTANGTGKVVIQSIAVNNNIISSVGTNANIVLTPQGSGSVVINNNQSLILPTGTTAQRPTGTNGMIRYNTSTSRYEGFSGSYWTKLGGVESVDGKTRILSESTPGAGNNVIYFYANDNLTATIDSTKLYTVDFQTNNLDITNNTISALTANTDINFSTTGTGGVLLGNMKFTSNTITNTVPNAITQFTETGAGYVKIAGTYGLVIPSGGTAVRPLTQYQETGMIRFNTDLGLVEVYSGTAWASVAGSSSGVTSATAQDIGVQTALLLG